MESATTTAQSLNVAISSRLMTSYESGSPVSHDREIVTAHDSVGNLMFFSIGNDGHLYQLSKESGSATGWKRSDLAHPQTVLLFHTKDFAPNSASRWVPRGNMSGVEITHITTGATKTGQVLIVVSTQQQNQAISYLINPDPTDTTWLWKEVPMPLESKSVNDIRIGHHARLETINGVDAMLYSLLQIDDLTSKLVLTSLPDFTFFNHEVALDFNPSAIELTAGSNGGTELFVGNTALVQLSPKLQVSKDIAAIQSNRIQIGKAAFPHVINKLVIGKTPSGALEAWILTEDGVLYFSQESAPGKFSEPLPIQRSIGQLTARRNEQTDAIDLFVVNLDNQLIHFWQDPTTTRWKQSQILLEGVNTALEFQAYTTQITLLDADNMPQAGKKVTIRASELTQVKINGKTYFIDAKTDVAECESDLKGQIVIENKITRLTSPLIRLEADFLNHAIEINPSAAIKEKLTQLSLDDLKTARLQTADSQVSEPLFTSNAEQLADAHAAIQELIKLHQTLPSDPSQLNAGVTSVDQLQTEIAIRDRASDFAHQIPVASLPTGYTWGLDLTGAAPVFSNQAAHIQANFLASPQAETAIGDFFSEIGHTFGDAWESIKNGFVKVTHLIIEKVEDGIRIIIKGVETAIHAVIQFAEQVWDVIQYVFEQIGAEIKKLVRWLGFIFNWKDILNTHTALRSMAGLTFTHFLAQADQLEDTIKQSFAQVREQVVGKTLEFDQSNQIFSQRPKGAARQQDVSHFLKPESTWIHQTLGNGFGGSVAETVEVVGELVQVVIDTLATEGLIIQNAMQEVMKDIVEQYDRLTFEDILKRLMTILTETLVNSVENVALSFVQISEILARALWNILNVRWNIPVITPLYETVIAPGSQLTLLDLACLTTAIPATAIYKALNGHTPFSPELTKTIAAAKDFDQLIQIMSGADQSARSLMAASAETFSISQSNRVAVSNQIQGVAISDDQSIRLATVQGVLAFHIGVVKLGSGLFSDLSEGFDLEGSDSAKQKANEAKFAFDVLGYVMTFTNATIFTATKHPSTPRQRLDLAMQQYLQILPRIKDGIPIFYRHKAQVDAPAALREGLAWAETGFGALTYTCSIASTILQAKEDPSPVSQEDANTLLGLKAAHNMCASTNQLLSGPKTAITRDMMKDDPIAAAVKVTLIAIRGGISTLVLPTLTLARAGVSMRVHDQFLDGSAGS